MQSNGSRKDLPLELCVVDVRIVGHHEQSVKIVVSEVRAESTVVTKLYESHHNVQTSIM
jgi:hypothetical protein